MEQYGIECARCGDDNWSFSSYYLVEFAPLKPGKPVKQVKTAKPAKPEKPGLDYREYVEMRSMEIIRCGNCDMVASDEGAVKPDPLDPRQLDLRPVQEMIKEGNRRYIAEGEWWDQGRKDL